MQLIECQNLIMTRTEVGKIIWWKVMNTTVIYVKSVDYILQCIWQLAYIKHLIFHGWDMWMMIYWIWPTAYEWFAWIEMVNTVTQKSVWMFARVAKIGLYLCYLLANSDEINFVGKVYILSLQQYRFHGKMLSIE